MAAGTRIGTGYVSVQPDFSGFQAKVAKQLNETLGPAMDKAGSNAGKRLSRSLGSNSDLRTSFQPLLKRFQKQGDNLGEELAARIGKGAKRTEGDMFGLSGAIKEMEKRSSSASSKAKILANDTFGVAHAARDAGQGYKLMRNATSGWAKDAKTADRVGSRLSKGMASMAQDVLHVGRNLKASAGGFGNFEGIMARANRGFQFFRNIIGSPKIPAIAAGVALLAQSLSALAAGAVATASALGPLSGALVAIPALALAGASAIGTLKLAFMGIGGAVKAATAVQTQGGEQATQVLRQQENAAEAVADAHRTLASSERDAKYAEEDLTKARKEATRQLEDMRRAADESNLSEREGADALRESRRELAKTLADPKANGLDIRQAEEAVERAQFALDATREEAKRARADFSEAQKKGVEGSTEVVSAKRAVEDANRSVEDSERGLEKAVRENTDAMQQQGSAATALQQKMAELTPTGRKFAKFLIGLKPKFDALREVASKGLFPGAETGIKSAMKNFGVVKKIVGETSGALGDLAAKAGNKLGSAAWGRDLGKIGESDTKIIERLGDAGLNLGDAFRNVLVSAEPLIEWMSKGTVKFSEWLKTSSQAGRETGSLGHFFDETRESMEKVWRILKPLGEGFLNVGHFAKGLGNEILDSLGDAAEGWAKWTKTTEGRNTLKNYFKEVRPAVFEIGSLIHDATIAFIELGRQKGVSTLVRALRTTLIPALRDGSGAITGMLSGFIQRFNKLRREGVPLFAAFLQDLAEHAAEAGKELAKALVTAFVNSDIWGKLAIGGWLFAKFGGGKAFESMGKKFGRQFSEAFLLAVLSTELAKQIKQIIEGEKLDAPKSEEFAKFLKEYFEVDAATITKPNRVKISTALGNILFNSETEKVVAVSNKKLQGIVGQIPEQFIVKFQEMSKLQGVLRTQLGPLPGIAGRTGTNLKKSLLPKLDDLVGEGQTKAESFRKKVGGEFEGLAATTKNAFENIASNIEAFYKALNIPKPKGFNIQKALKSLPELQPLGKQRGGTIRPAKLATGGLAATVPGTSTGDRHVLALGGRPVAKVESGEGIFVGNKRMMEAAQAANAAVPRFQTGGLAKRATGSLLEPKLEGNAGPLKQLGQAAIHKVFEGAKGVLDKHKAPAGGEGGSIANAGPLQQFNRIFPSHTLAELTGKARFSEDLVARIARWAGLPGRIFGQIAHGESDFYPGVYGIDPGGTVGRGLWQITSGVGNDAMIAQFGGPQAMFNPLINAEVAKKIYDVAGIGAWYGTKFVTGMQGGGLLRRALGGLVGTGPEKRDPRAKEGQPFNPQLMSGIAQSGPPLGVAGAGGFKPKTIGRIKAKALQIASAFTGYVWGGGHSEGTHVTANGLDCSGAVAKLMQQSGWSDFAVAVSTDYASRFHPGEGDLFTIWSNPDHTFANIEGEDWGTNSANGLGYASHTHAGFTSSHPELAPETAPSTAGAGEKEPPAEKVPDKYGTVYAGKRIPLGPMPNDLKSINAEITELGGKDGKGGLTKTYRKAQREADKEGKHAIAKAIGENLSSIQARLRGLTQRRTALRFKAVKEHLTKRFKKASARLGRYGRLIEDAQEGYEGASQYAEQVVGLEPQMPEISAQQKGESDKDYEARQEGAEKAYVANFNSYVEGRERPAYASVLDRVADWRNKVLGAEIFGFGKGNPSVVAMQNAWEGQTRGVDNEIDGTETFAQKVIERKNDWVKTYEKAHEGKAPKFSDFPDWLKAQLKQRTELLEGLPTLKLKDTRLREAIQEAREQFFPGGKNRLEPNTKGIPAIFRGGTGSLEESLKTIQGIHGYPEQHSQLGAAQIGPPNVPGRAGGVIWEVNSSIEELGVKVSSALHGLEKAPGSEETPDTSERDSLLEELLRQANERLSIKGALEPVIDQFKASYPLPFAGTFHTGGTIAGPSSQEFMAKVRGEERVRTPEQELSMAERIRQASVAATLGRDQMEALANSGDRSRPGAPIQIDQLHMHQDGTVTALYEGREFEVAVRDVVRSTPPSPGGGGGFGRVLRP